MYSRCITQYFAFQQSFSTLTLTVCVPSYNSDLRFSLKHEFGGLNSSLSWKCSLCQEYLFGTYLFQKNLLLGIFFTIRDLNSSISGKIKHRPMEQNRDLRNCSKHTCLINFSQSCKYNSTETRQPLQQMVLKNLISTFKNMRKAPYLIVDRKINSEQIRNLHL